ncbi:MAG: hypothetical protein AB7P69_29370 [Candidatus Binatia bacterium]
MKSRRLVFMSMVGVLALVLSFPAWAATHLGKVVEVNPDTLTMIDTAGGHQQTFTVPANAAISRAGKMCMLTDLQVGDTVTVIVGLLGDKTVATMIQANKLKATGRS